MAQSSSNNNNQSNNIAKMCKSKEYGFAYCFRPFHYFSRVFGYMPFSITFDSNAVTLRPTVKAFDVLWFLIAIIFYISTIIDFYIETMEIPHTSSRTLNRFARLLMIFIVFFGVFVIVMDLCNRFKFVNILNQFNRIDEKVCLIPDGEQYGDFLNADTKRNKNYSRSTVRTF